MFSQRTSVKKQDCTIEGHQCVEGADLTDLSSVEMRLLYIPPIEDPPTALFTALNDALKLSEIIFFVLLHNSFP